VSVSSQNCSAAGSVVTCTFPTMASGGGSLFLSIATKAPPAGTTATSTFDITSSDPQQFTNLGKSASVTVGLDRSIVVRNVEDDGFGSLRDALRDTNCATGCRIVFQIPQSSSAFVIQPRTPLPEVVGDSVFIDATTQNAPVELNGALLKSGNGFVLKQKIEGGVKGFAIRGFPDVGVLLDAPLIVELYRQPIGV